jgi:hypothetical protein
MSTLLKKRDNFQTEWRSTGIKDNQLEILVHMMRENTVMMENMEQQRKEKKAVNDCKIRDL